MELAEVYRVVYDGPEDMLHGIIVCKDEENGYQCLFRDKITHENGFRCPIRDDEVLEDEDIRDEVPVQDIMDEVDIRDEVEDEDISITMLKYEHAEDQRDLLFKNPWEVRMLQSSDHIIPNSPIKSSIRAKDGFVLTFYMFDSVRSLTFEYPYLHPDELSEPMTKSVVTKDGFRYLRVFYAIFSNAVEASVKVMLTNCPDEVHIAGLIAARTSAIEELAYSSLIFHKDESYVTEYLSWDDRVIPLSRDIVAVPLGHELILQFSLKLYPLGGSEEIVKHWLVFNAKDDGKSTESFKCSKGELKVEVSWRSTTKAIEAEAQDT